MNYWEHLQICVSSMTIVKQIKWMKKMPWIAVITVILIYTISQGFVKGPAKKFCTQSVFRPCIWNRGCCLFVSAMIHASVCSFLILPTGYLHRALTKRKKPQDNYISVTWQQAHHTCSVNTPATCPLWRLIWSQNSQVSLHQTWHKSYSATWCHITLTCWFTLRPVLYSHQERRDI